MDADTPTFHHYPVSATVPPPQPFTVPDHDPDLHGLGFRTGPTACQHTHHLHTTTPHLPPPAVLDGTTGPPGRLPSCTHRPHPAPHTSTGCFRAPPRTLGKFTCGQRCGSSLPTATYLVPLADAPGFAGSHHTLPMTVGYTCRGYGDSPATTVLRRV